MNLANKNHEFAATLGMDAEKLNETLKHSAKDGLLMFLEALQNMGKDVGFENATMMLAPAFKEMGLDAGAFHARHAPRRGEVADGRGGQGVPGGDFRH